MKLNDLPAPDAALEPQAISIDVLLEKYAKGNESSIEDVQRRVARALSQAEDAEHREHWSAEFLCALRSGFVPAGRVIDHR